MRHSGISRDSSPSNRWQPFREAAEALLSRSFAFDYVPLGEPHIGTPRHRAKMLSELAQGASLERVQRAMLDDRLRELVEDADCAAAVSRSWRRSHVDAVLLTLGGREIEPSRWEAIVRDAAYWAARERNGGILVCTRAEDLTRPAPAGTVGRVVLGLQDGACLGDDPDRLETLFQFGVRVVQLTYNTRNLLGDGCKEAADGGLSNLGRHLIHRMNALGIVVDTAHCGHRTTLEAIEVSSQPVAVTHSFSRAVFDHPRGKSDDVLRALRDTGGYFGLTVVPSFFVQEGLASLDDLARHLDHVRGILPAEQIGIGSDYGWITPDTPRELVQAGLEKFVKLGFSAPDLRFHGQGVEGFLHWEDWPNIAALLLAVGWPEAEVREVVGAAWLRFFARVAG
jgi:membrane dipeptidase